MEKNLVKYGLVTAAVFGILSLAAYYAGTSLGDDGITRMAGIFSVIVVLAIAAVGAGLFLRPSH